MEMSKRTQTTFYLQLDDRDAHTMIKLCDKAQEQINLMPPTSAKGTELSDMQEMIHELRGTLSSYYYVQEQQDA